MRTGLPCLVFLACLATPCLGQTCLKAPPPFLPGLFPEAAMGLPLQFTTDPTGGCTGMYRPASLGARRSTAWAVLAIDTNPDPTLGETADGVRARFNSPGHTVIDIAAWPVVMRVAPLGDEFVAIKGSVRVTILVKNGDHGDMSQALAIALMEQVLPKIPCG